MLDRFWSKVEKTDGCWNWTASKFRDGYGRITINKKSVLAHRVAYELLIGNIPKNKDLHHSCENKLCVNPNHLIPLSRKEHTTNLSPNSRAYKRSRQTHCIHGHKFSKENTYIGKDGTRHCRECTFIRATANR